MCGNVVMEEGCGMTPTSGLWYEKDKKQVNPYTGP